MVRRLNRVVPTPLLPAARTLYHRLFRLQLHIQCWFSDNLFPGRVAEYPPAILRYKVSESLSLRKFDYVGAGCARLIADHLAQVGIDFQDAAPKILDFGCGCGRAIRWLLRTHTKAQYYGADVDPETIAWCTKQFTSASFSTNSYLPPLPFSSDYFDAVYSLSVFTHLDESMQDCWLAELHRVLRPNGILFLTIHGRQAATFLDEADRNSLDKEGMIHRTTKKLHGLMPAWYQTTWHSESYIKERVARYFVDTNYHPVADGMQDVIVARKG